MKHIAHSDFCVALIFACALILEDAALGQTRIVAPTLSVIAEGREQKGQRSLYAISGNAEVPVPVAAVIGMPFLHVYGANTQSVYDAQEHRTDKDAQLTVGLLHHAAEGAPVWKAETGRAGRPDGAGFWLNRASLNIEKMFPTLRPNNSDKLDSWLGVVTVTGRNGRTYALPDFGWTWVSTSGFLFDFDAPNRFRIGYQDHTWMGALAWRQDWNLQDDETTNSRFRFETKRYLLAEASRDLSADVDLFIAAGVRLPNVATTSVTIRWLPKP